MEPEYNSITDFGEAQLLQLIPWVISILESQGEAYIDLFRRLQNLADRLSSGHFQLAVLGQFKRGKSSLINALLGEKLLPTSVVPLTAIPTFLKAGTQRRAKIFFKNNQPVQEFLSPEVDELREYLERFISEELNPKNHLGVELVEIEHPASILTSGLVLIDTPGIGSTFEHNTETTLNFIPQCDASLFIVSPDPPITQVEMKFLKEVLSAVNQVFFVFNKIDYLDQPELEKSISFFKKILSEQVGFQRDLVIFPVSSLLGLKAKRNRSLEDIKSSGLEELEGYLIKFLAQNKQKLLYQAIAKKTRSLIKEALLRITLSIQSLQMPIETLEMKRQSLEEKLTEAKDKQWVQKVLVEADLKRIIENLESQVQNLQGKIFMQILDNLGLKDKNQARWDEPAIQEKLEKIIPQLCEHEYGALSRLLEKQAKNIFESHQQPIQQLIEKFRKDAAEIFEIPFHLGETIEAFELEKNPYWVTHQWDSSFGIPPAKVVELFLPPSLKKKRIRRRIEQRIKDLVLYNLENIRWSNLQLIQDNFRKFITLLDQRFKETVISIQEAIATAYQMRMKKNQEVENQIQKWEQTKGQLESQLNIAL